jgi:hypothetical protein
VLLFVLSIAGLAFVSLTILFDKRLRAHPQPLIAYICIVEALMSWNALLQVLNPVWVSCYFGLNQILAYTTGHFQASFDQLTRDLNILCWSNSLFFLFFQSFSLLLNLCLCIDLIMTMYSPFKPASQRVKWYMTFSFLVPFIFIGFIAINNDIHNNCISDFYAPSENMNTTA